MNAVKRKRAKVEKKDGVTVAPCEHPRYRWRVTYTVGGERKQLYFRKKTGAGGADEEAENKREELEKEGRRQGEITPAERRAIHRFRDEVAKLPGSGNEATLADAIQSYLETLKRRHKALTVSLLGERLLDRVRKNGAGQSHLYTLERRLKRFERDYGEWLSCDVSTEVVDGFLEELSLAPRTTLHYRAALYQLFGYATDIGAAETNPVSKALKPKVKPGEVGILTPTQVRPLLAHAPAEILPGLALGFFAGIRRAELERIDWSEIDFGQGHIEVKASKAKTASRRIVPMQPNLKKWLQRCRKIAGPIMPSEMVWRTRLADAIKAAKLEEWPHNAPRHSFASYRLADTQDSAKVALELGHDRSETLFEHYNAVVTRQAAKAYWKIAPTTKREERKKVTEIARSAG